MSTLPDLDALRQRKEIRCKELNNARLDAQQALAVQWKGKG